MELSPYVTAVAEDLDRATALADAPTREVAARVATSLEPAIRLALVQALSDAAAAITADLDDAVVAVRMEGRDPVLDVRQLPPAAGEPSPAAPQTSSPDPDEDDDGGTARVTVRLPEALKRRAESHAGAADQSLNTWIVHTLRRAVDRSVEDAAADLGDTIRSRVSATTPRRVTGWA